MKVSAAPDLLRRFVPTPYQALFCLRGKMFVLKSDDADLLECLHQESKSRPEGASPDWVCILIRDNECPCGGPTDIRFGHEQLEIDTYQGGTQIVVDYGSKEMFGFVAGSDPLDHVAELFIRAMERVVQRDYQ